MSLLDLFNNNAFAMTAMSAAIDKMESAPNHIRSLGLFNEHGIHENQVAIEKREDTLSLIQTSVRGAPLEKRARELRDIRDFRTVRIAKSDEIFASELQFLRGFGEEQQIVSLQEELTRRMAALQRDIETTLENMYLGAVQGIVKDADDSTIYDYYTQFGISAADEIAFDLANTVGGALREMIQKEVIRPMRRAQKGQVVGRVYALCGDDFWDGLMKNAEFRETFLNQIQARELRDGYDLEEVSFAGVTWANYVGTDDNSSVAVPASKVKFFPLGNNNIFETVFSPGETFAELGQVGQPMYARVIPDRDRNEKVVLEVLSYPLPISRRPDLLFSGKAGAA